MTLIQKIINAIIEGCRYHLSIFLLIVTGMTLLMMFFYNPICIDSDPFFHLNRLLALMDALKDGSFPFYLDYNSINGYGYFTKAFYCDIILVPYALLGNITNINIAYKFLIFSTTILCGIFTYISVKRIHGSSFCATIAAILYTFAAVRIYMIYYFSSIAEFVSFSFIPLVFWGLYEITKGNYKKWYILAIAFSLIIFTHLLTTILTFATLLIFVAIYYKDFLKDKRRFLSLIYAGLSCLIICAYYIYPLLEQKFSNSFYFQTHPHMFITGNLTPFSRIFTEITNNLPNTDHSNYYPKMGGLLTAMICLRIFIFKKLPILKFADIGVIVGLIYIATELTSFPWLKFPFNQLIFIQFPWRLFKFSSYFFAIAGGVYLTALLTSPIRKIISVLFLSILLVLTFKTDSFDYRAMICNDRNHIFNEEIIAQNACIGGGAEYFPSRVPSYDYIIERTDSVDKTHTETQISDFSKKKGIIGFNVQINQPDSLELPLTYYKGYEATLNENSIIVDQSKNGVVQIPIKESGIVKVWYGGTMTQKISPYISLLGLLLLLLYIRKVKRNNRL